MKLIINYLEKFLQLSLRERLLVLFAVAVALYFLLDALLLVPQQQRIKLMNLSTLTHRQEIDTLAIKLAQIETEKAAGGNLMQRQRDELASLQKQVANVGTLFGPTDRGTSEQGLLLQELLAANPRVALAGLKTVPTTVFYSPANEAMGNKTGKGNPELKSIIYRSGIEVSLKGSFPDLLSYLQSLEQRSDRLFWSNARLDVTTYPESILKLDISALSEVASVPLN